MQVNFTMPLRVDLVLEALVALPAVRSAQARTALYALAINRYNKLVLSDDAARLKQVADALSHRNDVLVGDASCAVTSAIVSGHHAAALLSRGVHIDVSAIRNGEYVRCEFGQTAVIIHRGQNDFLIHWPEVMTEYVGKWFASVVGLKRA
jgi:sarcosine oxidase gamma subunit